MAILLYDSVTTQGWVGPHHSLNAVAFDDLRIAFIAKQPGPIEDDRGRAIVATEKDFGKLSHPETLPVPGGDRTIGPVRDPKTLAWLRSAHAGSEDTFAVRSASLVARRPLPSRETRRKALCGDRASLATEYDPKPVFATSDAMTKQPEVHRLVRELLVPTSATSKVDPDRTSRREGGAWGSNP